MKTACRIGFFATLLVYLFAACQNTPPAPEPFGATPSPQQAAWQQLEYYAFVHFNMNTFTDVEWGEGQESPQSFNPAALDCNQWAQTAKAAGMKGIIITAKHHDGFCLWPTQYSEHSVKNSPWREGKGDLLRELSDACKAHGLKFGVYLSPWDRNNPLYGTPEYNEYFKKQLTEVLTNYGPVFEVWFDGANGEGPNGKKQEYDWPGFIATVREHQPDAVIFSDAGPDIRWVGTEAGFAMPTNWSTLNRDDYYPGTPRYLELRSGNKRGTHWLPAEVDVSIRPGWYYHADQDELVKSPDHLELIYYESVGRNANLLLNLPVDKRGLVHPNDSTALMDLKSRLDATFTKNLISGASGTADAIRGNAKSYGAAQLTDGNYDTYWTTDDGITQASAELSWSAPITANVLALQEYIPLGQRIDSFSVEVWSDHAWMEVARGSTIGYKRMVNLPALPITKLRINILSAMAAPVLSEAALYFRPHNNYLLESKMDFDKRMAWWRDAKFGMFIHWGAYAVPAGIYKGKAVGSVGEWIMNTAQIPVAEYEKFAKAFNPVKYNAEEWVRTAKDAGMQYIVITSKHHDGFGLWNSETSGYNISKYGDFGRDALAELSAACQKEGVKLCFYYSIMDWHHPDAQAPHYPEYNTSKKRNPNFHRYAENYMKPQLKELVERYQPAVLWFDGEWMPEWTEAMGKDLYQYIRSLKPDIIINNRVGKGRAGMQGMNRGTEFVGDFGTPEQEILANGSSNIDWESCMTMNDTWGFKRNDQNWKPAETLVHNLVDIAAKGGNYLLNVGPTAEGLIPAPSVERLAGMGRWMKTNGEAIYGARMWKTYQEGEQIRFTKGADHTVYATALTWPGEQLTLKALQPEDGSEIHLLGYEPALEWTWDEQSGLTIRLPEALQDAANRPSEPAYVFKVKTED